MTANDLNCRSRPRAVPPLSSTPPPPSASVAWLTRLPARVLSEIKMHYEYAIKITYTHAAQRTNKQLASCDVQLHFMRATHYHLTFPVHKTQHCLQPSRMWQHGAAWQRGQVRSGFQMPKGRAGTGQGGIH